MAYVTLAQIRQHGDYDPGDTGQDAEISALIPRAQSAIESYTNNVFEISAVSTRVFDAPTARTASTDDEYDKLYFDNWLASTTDLVITNGDATTVTGTDYVTLPRNHTPIYGIELKSDSDVSWEYDTSPESAISIEGYWGYSITPPSDVVLACMQLVLHWLRVESQAVSKDMPDDVCMLLKPFKRKVQWL